METFGRDLVQLPPVLTFLSEILLDCLLNLEVPSALVEANRTSVGLSWNGTSHGHHHCHWILSSYLLLSGLAFFLFSPIHVSLRGKKKNPQDSEPKGVDSKPSLAAESRLGQVTGPLGHLFFRPSVRAACAPSIGCLRKPRRKHLTNYNVL